MPQIRLPEELIPLVVSYFAHDKHTLYSLLTINKVFFNAAASILYKNPFRTCFWRKDEKVETRQILNLLLASSSLLSELTKPKADMGEILRWGLTGSRPTIPFTVNYLDYYTEIHHLEWASKNEISLLSGIDCNLSLLFCQHNAEKVESICLPMFGMGPYLPIVRRMSSLRRVEFCGIQNEMIRTNNQYIVAIQDAIEFVKAHVEAFGGTLTEIKIPNLIDLKRSGIRPDAQILEIIQIMKQPQVIDMDDSYDFCQYLQGSTTDHLRVFRGPLIKYNEEIQGWDSISFLQRCPKLEKVRFNPTQPNTFKWAVKRRDLLTASDLELGRSSTSKLVPLQDVHMQCQYCTSLSIVQDIVYAFRNTIKSITVEEHLHPRFHFNPEPLRWDWLLPNLVKIHIDETDFTLFDFGSLNLCPSLEDLHLTGGYGDIDCDVIPEFGPILKLPNLRNIQLEYEISFQFDLASLQYSPLLETLIISNDVPLSEDDESPMIRPTDSPCWEWTWDWYLPHLKRMDLTGESAFLFQFRFISSCPSLQYLRLDTDEYERSMSLDQIARTGVLLPSAYKNQVNEVKHRFEFALQGRWEMSKYTLHVLLLQYMPHVTDIDFSCANRIDPLGVIDVTQKLSHVRNVTFNLACHDPDIEDTLKYLSEHGRGTFGSVNYTMLQ